MYHSPTPTVRIGCWLLAALVPATAGAVERDAAARVEPKGPVDTWDQPIGPLEPVRSRTEAQTDQIKAAALVAHGRILLQQGKLEQALARYQRAHRYSADTISIVNDVVGLAFQLGRNETAARYAIIAAELDPTDAELTAQLGRFLTEKLEFERAIGLYERAIALYEQDTENDAAQGQVILLLREIGRLRFVLEQYEQAADAFARVRQALDDPDQAGLNESQQQRLLGKPELTYLLLGEAFLKAKRYDDAEALFRKVNQAKPDEAVLAYQLARVDAGRGKVDRALEQLDKYFAAKLATGGTEPYELLEQLLAKAGGGQDAAAARRQTIERLAAMQQDDPSNAALAYRLAQLYRDTGRLDEAAVIYGQMIELEPTLDAFQGLIDIYLQQGNVEQLLDALGRAVLRTASLEPLGSEAEAVVDDKQMVDKLVSRAQRQRSDDPESLTVGSALGAALVALAAKQFHESNQLFRHAYDRSDPETRQRVVTAWGLEMFMADQFGRAAAAFRRAIGDKVAPDNEAGITFYLAGALEMDGKTNAALDAAEKAAQLDQDSPRFASRTAWILYHAQRYDEAEQAYLNFLKTYDLKYGDEDVREVLRDARLVLSNIAIQQDRMPLAEEYLEQVLDEYPEDIGALNDLGYLWADQNKHLRRALNMIQAAVDAEPDNVAYRDSLGWAYYRLGRFDDAVRELEQAAGGDQQPDGVILDHLGDALLKAGEVDRALREWRRAAEAFGRDEERQKLQDVERKINQHQPQQ